MLHDRGIKKWQGFFMTEHTGLLNEFAIDYKKEAKPILDEQELEVIGVVVMESLNYTLDIKVRVWKDGFFKVYQGIVNKVDYQMKYIQLETADGLLSIMINDITAVERI